MANFQDTNNKGTALDPNFFFPPNVIDLQYKDIDNTSDEGESSDAPESIVVADPTPVDSGPEVTVTDDITPEATYFLPIPESISVVSQTVRARAGGGYAVDVVIEIADLPGIENFDLAVTKA